ncbi:hypothetical protein M569_00069 [Genlisea aurea]|uniref:Uncharacterized protein n=1 Tax=Genlisea aurea TaxID=192259 RepID=S8D4J7_9LAMI|nr:hypothetical protein M569_00069 [Genlisea aurea]
MVLRATTIGVHIHIGWSKERESAKESPLFLSSSVVERSAVNRLVSAAPFNELEPIAEPGKGRVAEWSKATDCKSVEVFLRRRQNASLVRDEAKPKYTIGEGKTPHFIAPGERKFDRGLERGLFLEATNEGSIRSRPCRALALDRAGRGSLDARPDRRGSEPASMIMGTLSSDVAAEEVEGLGSLCASRMR